MKVDQEVLIGKDLNLDTKDEGLAYLLNGQIIDYGNNSNDYFVQNSPSNELCISFPKGFELKGIIDLLNNEKILFFKDTLNNSYEIGKVVDCSYFKIVNAPCLNLEQRVTGEYKFFKNKRRIYWTDGINPPRYLDIDNPFPKQRLNNDCSECTPEYSEDLDCNRLKIWGDVEFPNADITSFKVDGNLPNGVYQIAISRTIDKIRWSDYYIYPKVIKVHSNRGERFGIKVQFDCLEFANYGDIYSQGFEEIQVVLIQHRADRGFVSSVVGYYDSNIKEITIYEIPETAEVISSEVLLSRRPVYQKANHIVAVSDYLVLGGLTERKDIDYRSQANKIQSRWKTIKVKASEAYRYPSYMRGEVYAHYIRWIYKDGERTTWTHIPCNHKQINSSWFDEIDNADSETGVCEDIRNKRWQLYDTSVLWDSETPFCYNCNETVGASGLFGWWESQLKYPDNYPDFSCDPIKYHKFPSNKTSPIHDNTLCVGGVPQDPCINILTIEFYDIEFPANIEDIVGYEIGVAERDKSIMHKGLLFNMVQEVKDNRTTYYANYPFNDLSYDRFLATELEKQGDNGGINHVSGDGDSDRFQYDKYVYQSPDIHYIKGETGTSIELCSEEIAQISLSYEYTYGLPKYQMLRSSASSSLTDWAIDWALRPIQYGIQYNSVGHYNQSAYNNIKTGNLIRSINFQQYLLPTKQLVDNVRINNLNRESGIYLDINGSFDKPFTVDYSRVRITDIDCHTQLSACSGLGTKGVSYYSAMKVDKPAQYGSIGDHQIRQVTNILKESNSGVVYGGDVYITKFQMTRKFPFFTALPIDQELNSPFDLSEHMNIWYPIYWMSTEDQGLIKEILDNISDPGKEYYLDDSLQLKGVCVESDPTIFDSDFWKGKVGGRRFNPNQLQGVYYTHAASIHHFFVESEFINDFREIDEVYDYTQDDNLLLRRDKLDYPEKFLYDLSYLSNGVSQYTSVFTGKSSNTSKFRIINSLKGDPLSGSDNWLVFKSNDFLQFTEDAGNITRLQQTDFDNLLIAFENAVYVTQAGEGLLVQNNNVVIGSGDVFTRKLLRLSYADNGYTGSIDKFSFVNTRFGTVWVDRKRKKVFIFASQLKDITGRMQSWFNEYMTEDITCGYDPYTDNVYISTSKWNISYNLKRQAFISFHSFNSKFYSSLENNMFSSDSKGLWKHNSKYNYQTYYGKLHPFEVGMNVKTQLKSKQLDYITTYVEFIKELGYNNKVWKDIFFDKILVWNRSGSTGIMSTYLKNKDSISDHIAQVSSNVVEVTKLEDFVYKLNNLQNRIQNNNNSVFKMNGMLYDSLNTQDKPFMGSIRGIDFNVHLIFDSKSDIKVLFPLLLTINTEIVQ